MALRAIYILFEIPLFFDSPCRIYILYSIFYSDARRAGRNTDGAGGLNKNPTLDNGLVAAQVRNFLLSPAARNDTLVQLQRVPAIDWWLLCCHLVRIWTSALAACPRAAAR